MFAKTLVIRLMEVFRREIGLKFDTFIGFSISEISTVYELLILCMHSVLL
jgi:hypothetical protein